MYVYISFGTIKLNNNGLAMCSFQYLLYHVFDHVCTSFIGTKQISNIKHLMTFNIKREVVHVDIIILALRLTIKSRIHAIHTTKGGSTMLCFVLFLFFKNLIIMIERVKMLKWPSRSCNS
jgi:hypothetical protein